jgi:hypothetical protein
MTKNISKILILSLAIFGFNFVQAEAAMTCHVSASCDSSEVSILELSDTVNAHAGLPGAGYPYSVCCSGATGLSTSCSQNKIFAKLSGATNAHVRLNTEADYPGSNNTCLSVTNGSLTIGNQDNNCSGYDTTIISLAKVPTNSHIGESDAYPHKICAKYTPPSSGGGSGWLPPSWFAGSSEPEIPVAVNVVPIVVTAPVAQVKANSNSNIESTVPVTSADSFEPTPIESVSGAIASTGAQVGNNLLPAAVGQSRSGLSTLINSIGFKILITIVILAMVIFSRKYFRKRK